METKIQRMRRTGRITKGQTVTYSPEYMQSERLRTAIGRVVKMFGEVPCYPGFIEVDFGPHGTFVGTLSAICPTPRLVYSSASA
ncbi:MAG: hypothetical protein EON60_10260 [Alphaproteobacteria bacterium]|nr:MAG: hypothetical protein EON60_10260 [Alphaproteobacteria bacterium]